MQPTEENFIYHEHTITLYRFGNPMMHPDWHTAEDMGLKYLYFDASGNDYWDNDMVFCRQEDYDIARAMYESWMANY